MHARVTDGYSRRFPEATDCPLHIPSGRETACRLDREAVW